MGSRSFDRRDALRAAAALAVAVPLAGCEPTQTGDWHGAGPSPVDGPSTGSGASPAPSALPASPASAAPLSLPAEVVHGPADRSAVALTFHGQGDVAMAGALLTELENGGARATVLAVGSWLQANPTMARRILDGGHELGNHTQNHADIKAMSAADAYAEINDCAEVLRRLTGSIGTWFRPSQTQYSTAGVRAQATRVGYRTCLSYDLDSLDYTDPGAGTVVGNVAKAIQKGSIVSLHFGHGGTVTAIPTILANLDHLGLRAVTMTELMTP